MKWCSRYTVKWKSMFQNGMYRMVILLKTGGFRGGSLSGEESTSHCRRHRFDPCSGKIPHVTEQLSPCTAAVEPVLWNLLATDCEPCPATTEAHTLEPVLLRKRWYHSMKPVHHNWRVAPTLCTERKAHAARKTQHSQKYMYTCFPKSIQGGNNQVSRDH